ncbi:hypothetical protein R1sor_008894 [Riccia sorocarpa]|uniref:Transposase n=1 Tax=Riccia sorocarpa TaxID=122646 RepID=A0ABD3H7H8_9MARC
MNRFRPVNGLPDEDLNLVWSQLAEGSVWVSRPAKYQGLEDVVALKEYCKALKGKDKLGKAIVRYWMTRYQEERKEQGSEPALASSSQQPGLASTCQQPARAVTDEDEIEDTDAAKFVFDDEVENEARTHLGNARRRVVLNPNIV